MRAWRRANGGETCGFDGVRIPAREPVQEIHIPGLTVRFRCEAHAEGVVDWTQINAEIVTPARPADSSFTRTRHVRLPFDPKLAATGDLS